MSDVVFHLYQRKTLYFWKSYFTTHHTPRGQRDPLPFPISRTRTPEDDEVGGGEHVPLSSSLRLHPRLHQRQRARPSLPSDGGRGNSEVGLLLLRLPLDLDLDL